TYKAAATANLVNTNIKSGVTIGGVVGNVTPSPASCASDGASNCVVDGSTYKAAALANAIAGNIRSGVSIAGVSGTYPSASTPLVGADGTADLENATLHPQLKSNTPFEWFNSAGVRYTAIGSNQITAQKIKSGVT